MRTFITVFILLGSITAATAQRDDMTITVRKKPVLTLSPDSMYFDSHTARRFILKGVPDGYTIKVDFNGANMFHRDSLVILQPFFVYRDSDIMKYRNGRLMGGEKMTSGDYYITSLSIKIVDKAGSIQDSLSRTCYIRPQEYQPSLPLSSATFDPKMKSIISGRDSVTVKPYGPQRKVKE